ncbi:MAG: hypothetical protein E7395_03525 [Ruminococcaceae bacterium]|nr:hypothetical protein [Oscillospiraceae bacterium]
MVLRRVKILFVSVILILAMLCTKLLYIGIYKHGEYSSEVFNQQQRETRLEKVRGQITDKNGITFTDRSQKTVYIGNGGKISAKGTVGANVPKRYEPNGIAAHAVGYITDDSNGVSGAEKIYNSFLKSSGYYRATYLADGSGTPLANQRPEVVLKKEDSPKSVRLTIDYHIQKITEKIADKKVEQGAIVVLDAKSFDVLAMVSRPGFDRNSVEAYLSSEKGELLNRALCGYNAGSVFKIITSAAILDKYPDYTSKKFHCSGMTKLGDKSFACHEALGHSDIDFFDGFSHSCNCVFYESGIEIGASDIFAVAKKIGLGEKILFWNEESEGNITHKSEYSLFETVNMSIGQGDVLITPLQCAVVAATVANGGVRKSVNIAGAITDENGKELQHLKQSQSIRVMKESTAKTIGSMMRQCVISGTAKKALATSIAGKTGSAETGWLTSDGKTAVHGWFCGYFPFDNPQYAMAVFCENGQSGAGSCVEPFIEIYEEIDKIYPFKQ